MIESPILTEIIAEQRALAVRKLLLEWMRLRFGTLPPTVGLRLEAYSTEAELLSLLTVIERSPTLKSFLSQLPPPMPVLTTA